MSAVTIEAPMRWTTNCTRPWCAGPQLSSSAPPPTSDQLRHIVDSPATTLFIARDELGTVVGSLTLALFSGPDRCTRPGWRT